MERVSCQKCQIPYRRRSLVAHQSKCEGGIEGFTPVYENRRYVYMCQGCGLPARKQNTLSHKKRCTSQLSLQRQSKQISGTASSISLTKDHGQKMSMAEAEISSHKSMKDSQIEADEPLFFEKLPQLTQPIEFYCPVRKQMIAIEKEDFMIEEEQLQPHPISQEVLQREQIQANLRKLTSTEAMSYHSKLKQFRTNINAISPSLTQSIQIYSLSCLLRLIGRFTHEKRWQQARGLIKRSDFWEFMGNVQPWILNNKSFVSISEEKLKYFVHDDENFIVANFDFVYQRIKGLLENYKISPAKIERLFEKPVHKRPKQTRTKRKNPQTARLRLKIIRFRSRQKYERRLRKNPYGIRKLTQLKYQTIKYQVEAVDEAFQMKQVFRKKPSINHRAEIARKRQRIMINFCMAKIADELTASIVLGEFKIWSKSIENVNSEDRYLYVDQIPSIPAFQFWYPLTIDILKEKKWYFPYAYQRCHGYFESPLPQLSQEEIFRKLYTWYRSKGLIIDHSLYQLQGFDGIRALIDDKYRIEQEKKRLRMKILTIEVNPTVIFPEDEQNSEDQLSADEDIQFAVDVPARGDREKWRIVHQAEHLTGFNNCAACEEPLKFPAPSCKSCLSAYHHFCRRELLNICICFVYSDNSLEKMQEMFDNAINEAKENAKHVDLNVKMPPRTNIMELKYQEENLGLNMEAATHVGLWCRPGSISYHKSSNLMFLRDKNLALLEAFGKSSVFPGSIEEIPGKGRGVIAVREIKKNEIVAIYPGSLITQAEIIQSYKNCKYIFNFQDGPTPFTSWAIVPVGVAHLGMFINHGIPNVVPTRLWSSKGPLLLFISLQKIDMGEEILYNYGLEYHGHKDFI